jgi:2,3-diketo-5-methylthio-1-phosphopentane phosphatase
LERLGGGAGIGAREEAVADARALLAQWEADIAGGVAGADGAPLSCVDAALSEGGAGAGVAAAALAANVAWQMASNRKAGPLKALQGHIWRSGYEAGALRGHVFPDVPAALAAWRAAGVPVYIYSSGSREAQVLLFRHSSAGDLTPLLSGYFDTRVGPKLEAASYRDIALSIGVAAAPGKALFLTDSLGEAVAARDAGWTVAVTVRPDGMAFKSPRVRSWRPVAEGARVHVIHPRRALALSSWELDADRLARAIDEGYACGRDLTGT